MRSPRAVSFHLPWESSSKSIRIASGLIQTSFFLCSITITWVYIYIYMYYVYNTFKNVQCQNDCMPIYIYIYIYTITRTYVYIYTHIYTHIHTDTRTHINIHEWTSQSTESQKHGSRIWADASMDISLDWFIMQKYGQADKERCLDFHTHLHFYIVQLSIGTSSARRFIDRCDMLHSTWCFAHILNAA